MSNKDYPEKIYCPVFKHKIHCSRIEHTEASELPEDRVYEFCLTKCPIYKRHKGNINRDETGEI
ncbi:hypothetical protein KKC91_01915 [bacterium]|nr:hypothetical protein [bacterium]